MAPLNCHDSIWCFLHGIILNIPPNRLPLFPALAGSVWFLTLASLLLTWIAYGMPQYPGQYNPHIAFISDIASFELKPLFLAGASITAVGFAFTVATVHVVRYEPGFALVRCPHLDESGDDETRNNHNHDDNHDNEQGEDEEEEDHDTLKTLKVVSLLSIFAASIASLALIFLGVMDTFRYKHLHHIFLRICFAGLAVQSACTAIVYFNEVLGASLSTALILIEVFLAVAFISLTVSDDAPPSAYRAAGILEWIIAFLGTIYLWLFCGFLDQTNFHNCVPSPLYRPGRKPSVQDLPSSSSASPTNSDPERAPLLAHSEGRKYT
ncbi:hypothetical protein EYZ11_004393 [Aspergillus tanneri]|uniref:CWH43-like N-terminal domain-containing protein n=1 Tax=Aspergillus tanneri TaxID=1220188 RepID=A0A4S3JKL3_9EURO|nr:hypothetical protein EYZ11_004393 [Aspergillus tanneri]